MYFFMLWAPFPETFHVAQQLRALAMINYGAGINILGERVYTRNAPTVLYWCTRKQFGVLAIMASRSVNRSMWVAQISSVWWSPSII
jgi:hypothetical protein